MSDSTIFTEQQTPEAQTEVGTQPTGLQIPTEAAEFIGSGKKYQTPEEALKSVPHAQKHIQTLEQELAQTKEELAKRKAAAELLDDLKSGLTQKETPQAVEFDQDKLEQLINRTLTVKEQQKLAQSNTQAVASKFTDKFGDKAEEVYNTIAKESGLTVQQLNSLAATSPSAVLKLAGLDKMTSSVPSKSTGSVNTEQFNTPPKDQALSARVPKGASTKDLVQAWRNAGEKVKQQISTS